MSGERVSPREWRWVLAFAALIVTLTAAPYIAGWLAQGEGWRFTGALFGVEDANSYLAKMRLGARGEWLFTLRTSSESHEGALLFLPYLLLGHVARLVTGREPVPTETLIAAFHGARLVFDLALILVIYRFAAVFLRRPATRRLALALITLGGGLGWLVSLFSGGEKLFGSLPVDFIVPEGYTFLILFGLPHLALARAALLGGLLCLFAALRRSPFRNALLAGACWAVMGLAVPFYIPVVYAVLGAWGLAAWLRSRRFPTVLFVPAVIAALVPLPVLLYNAWAFLSSDVFSQWAAQNWLPSPHPAHYVLGYAVLGIPAVVALCWAWQRGAAQAPYLLLASWIVAAPVLVYLPVNVQRRLAEGVIVPLGILAAVGLARLARGRRWVYGVTLVVALGTSGLLWLGGVVSALAPGQPIFRPADEIAAMEALDALAPPDAVVLCVHETGNVLPARTNLIAYVGHGPETIHADEKEARVSAFFRDELDPAARAALLNEVDYVFVGPLERAEARGTAWQRGLREIETRGDGAARYVIYEVRH